MVAFVVKKAFATLLAANGILGLLGLPADVFTWWVCATSGWRRCPVTFAAPPLDWRLLLNVLLLLVGASLLIPQRFWPVKLWSLLNVWLARISIVGVVVVSLAGPHVFGFWATEAALLVAGLFALALVSVYGGEERPSHVKTKHVEAWRKSSLQKRRQGQALCIAGTIVLMGVAWLSTPPRSRITFAGHQLGAIEAGKPAKANVYFLNDGGSDAEVSMFWVIQLVDTPQGFDKQLEQEDKLAATLAALKQTQITHRIPRKTGHWGTSIGPVLTAEQIQNMKSEKAALFFLGEARYWDLSGGYVSKYCWWTHGDPKVLFTCNRHNEHP